LTRANRASESAARRGRLAAAHPLPDGNGRLRPNAPDARSGRTPGAVADEALASASLGGSESPGTALADDRSSSRAGANSTCAETFASPLKRPQGDSETPPTSEIVVSPGRVRVSATDRAEIALSCWILQLPVRRVRELMTRRAEIMVSRVRMRESFAQAKALEIGGCSSGRLGRRGASARVILSGYDIVANDPQAPEGEPFLRVSLEDFAGTLRRGRRQPGPAPHPGPGGRTRPRSRVCSLPRVA
jgi:hypothetical protein